MTVVTRFPPSPTGFMHIGNARTALYNWLYAKHTGGKMVFRIEDTDRERHSEEAVTAIVSGMKWLGLDWDGEIISQFSRRERHAEVALDLVKRGKAYYCYCTPEELEEMREKARAEGSPTFYDRRWRDKDPSEAPAGIKPVIRIKAPLTGETILHDHVQGDVRINNEQLDDMIILRSDGVPTYMLAVVVDDHDMGVTHVIRGDDHLNNTFRQKTILDGMGWPHPEYAHLPLILSADGSKMSKRKGAASVEEYRDLGYLPEALCNYLLRLGWGHGDDEIISREQAIEWFDLAGIVKSPARWDFDKLNHLNAHYIKQADNTRLLNLIVDIFEKYNLPVNDTAKKQILAQMDELKSRAKTLLQMADECSFYVRPLPFEFDDKAKATLDNEGIEVLKILQSDLQNLDNFEASEIETLCRSIADTHKSGKLAKVMMPFRAALTGRSVSPSIFHAAEILGKDETLKRIQILLNP